MSDAEATPETAPPPRRARRWKKRLLALGFGAGLGFLAVEVCVRVAWDGLLEPTTERPLIEGADLEVCYGQASVFASPYQQVKDGAPYQYYRHDPRRGFRLAADTVAEDFVRDGEPDATFTITTDAHGLRGPRREPPPADALEVLVVGDSMAFGKGVQDDETFPYALEAHLAEALGRPVRVYNAGVSSYGQIEELATLEELVPVLEPDVVLLAFTVANDVTDDLRWREGVQPLEPNPEALAWFEHVLLDNPLGWWSKTYRLLAWRWGRHLWRYRLMRHPELLDLAGRLLAACRDAAGGRPFGVVIVPPEFEVRGYWAEPWLEADEIRDGIVARMQAQAIPVLDPLPTLQEHSHEPLYIPGDLHFTAEGGEVFAQAIAPFVADLAREAE
ncbi:MAG: SGNH/GDSL hydrolase family protein [Planctomycetota bacterium]